MNRLVSIHQKKYSINCNGNVQTAVRNKYISLYSSQKIFNQLTWKCSKT